MRKFVIAVMAGALALAGAACGGDDDSGDDAVEAEDDDAASNDASEDAAEEGDDAAEEEGDDSDAPEGDPDSDFCKTARSYDEEFGDEDVPDEEAVAALEDLADDAPEELQESMDLLVEFGYALVEAGDDDEAQTEVFNEFGERLMSQGDELTVYLEEVCGVDSSDDSSAEDDPVMEEE
jgi:hypothetical protein